MAELVNVTELGPGKVYIHENQLYSVLDINRNKTAMAKMKVKMKVQNLRSGAIEEVMFFGGDRVELAYLEKKTMQFLYSDENFGYFMDKDTYDQVQIPHERISHELNFLAPEADVTITYFRGEILGIALPAKVVLRIVETDDNAVAGDTVNRAMKPATLETGYQIKVPIFVKNGEKVIIRTDTGAYDSRAETGSK